MYRSLLPTKPQQADAVANVKTETENAATASAMIYIQLLLEDKTTIISRWLWAQAIQPYATSAQESLNNILVTARAPPTKF